MIKSLYRNFVRKPITNLINLVGLAVSLALVIILSVYSYSELNTDNYHKNGDRVFIFANLKGQVFMPAILKDQIDLNIPEVETAIRLAGTWEAPVFQVEDHDPITSDLIFADDGFFNLFTYKAAEGNPETALKEPMTVVVTKPLAEKLFGKSPALGKIVKLNNDKELTVSAVINEPEANTCLSFSAITSVATRKIVQSSGQEFTDWGWCNFQTFILLKKGANPDETALKIQALFPKNEHENYTDLKLNPFKETYFSQFPLADSDYFHFGVKQKVMILVMVAALVLMIALINFINISSSQWMEKIRQTGVLKVIGANKSSILKNVLFEAFILFLMSLFLAIGIVQFLFPFIHNYTGIHFNLQLLYTPTFLISSITGIFFLSLIFSIIPALRISSSKAVDNLKKSVNPGASNSIFRGVLVTAQFVIAIVLISFTILVQKQVNFGSSTLGFNQENTIGIKLTPQLYGSREVLKKLLLEKPTVAKISFTQYFPGNNMSNWGMNQMIDGVKRELNFDIFNADAPFFEMTGLQLTQGRFYSADMITDKNKLIVNETFLRENKIENPIGTKFVLGMGTDAGLSEIIGVVKDFHYKAFDQPIGSLCIQNQPGASYCLVNLNTKDFNSLNATVQEIKAAT
ncbi:MAG: ABC transporter permease, partial [Mariniphaga sp.]